MSQQKNGQRVAALVHENDAKENSNFLAHTRMSMTFKLKVL